MTQPMPVKPKENPNTPVIPKEPKKEPFKPNIPPFITPDEKPSIKA